MIPFLLLLGCPRPEPEPPPGCYTLPDGSTRTILQVAVDDAEEGDTIDVCRGGLQDMAVIDKPLVIQGADDSETFLYAEANGIVVDGADVTIADLTVFAGGTAFIVRDGKLTLDGANVGDPAQNLLGAGEWAIDASNSEVIVDHAEITQAMLGGVHLDGGTLTMTDSEISQVMSYGVLLEGWADAVIEDNEISDVYYSGNASYIFTADGIAVAGAWYDDVRMARNEITGCQVACVQMENSLLSMDGDVVEGGFANFLFLNSVVTMNAVTMNDASYYGGYVRTASLTTTDTTITIDPSSSSGSGTSSETGSMGLLVMSSDLAMTRGTITGANGAGIEAYAITADDPSTVTLTDVTIDDCARFGVAVYDGSLAATNVTVSNTRSRSDSLCVDDEIGDVCNFAVYLAATDATWTGGAITGSDRDGVVLDVGRFEGSDVAFSDSGGETIRATDGAVLLTGGTFADSGSHALYLLRSYGELDGTAISGGRCTTVAEQDDGSIRTTYEDAVDVYVEGGILVATGATFTDGEHAIRAVDSEVLVTASTFSTYAQSGIELTGGTAELLEVDFAGVAGPVVSCTDGAVDVLGTYASDVTAHRERYEVESGGDIVESHDETVADPAVFADGCALEAQVTAVAAAAGDGVKLVGGTVQLDDLIVSGAAGWGMTCDVTEPPTFDACDVTVDGALGASDCIGCP